MGPSLLYITIPHKRRRLISVWFRSYADHSASLRFSYADHSVSAIHPAASAGDVTPHPY